MVKKGRYGVVGGGVGGSGVGSVGVADNNNTNNKTTNNITNQSLSSHQSPNGNTLITITTSLHSHSLSHPNLPTTLELSPQILKSMYLLSVNLIAAVRISKKKMCNVIYFDYFCWSDYLVYFFFDAKLFSFLKSLKSYLLFWLWFFL